MPEPFPLLNFESGFLTNREPMVAPQEAFRELNNARVFRGRLEKRKGYEYFSILGEPETENLGVPADPFSGTCGELPVIAHEGSPSLYFVTFDDGTHTVTDLAGDGVLCWTAGPGHDDGAVGTINYTTGAYTVDWPAAPGTVTLDYEYERALPVMGIEGYFPQQGGEFLIAFDTQAMWQYNPVEERFYKISADLWSCAEEVLGDGSTTSADFFWTEVWGEMLVIANGIEPVYYYDSAGPTIAEIDSDWTGGGDSLDTAMIVMRYKGRLVFLRTQEDGSNYPGRARWTTINADLTGGAGSPFDVAGYADCPTTDWIVSAAFLSDSLYVLFERSVWELEHTGDPLMPFAWKEVAGTEGSFAKMSTIDFSDEIITHSALGLISTDGIEIKDAAEPIPDFSLDWNPLKIHYTFGLVIEEERAALWTGVPNTEETVTQVLGLQYEDSAFYTADLPFLVYGYYYRGADLIWDDLGMDFDDADFTWDEKEVIAGYPTVLGGARDGRIYTINTGQDDDGEDISLSAETVKLRPYPLERARLQYIDFLSDGALDPVIVKVYRDLEETPRRTISVSLTQQPGSEKVHQRVKVNLAGAFFRIRLEHSSSSSLAIDAVIPWFEKIGVLTRMTRLKGV